ncbi:MAG: DUF3079 domain-containing protein [Steroidobacteraceae bacterium]
MNYLGRNRTSCATGLRDYHRAVRRLRQCARRGGEALVVREQLERLHFDVEVDVLARSGPRATERMTGVEADVFYPTLVHLRETLAVVAASQDPAAWQRPLGTALDGLRQAVRCLRRRSGNGKVRTPHPVELFGADWLEHGLDAETQRERGAE